MHRLCRCFTLLSPLETYKDLAEIEVWFENQSPWADHFDGKHWHRGNWEAEIQKNKKITRRRLSAMQRVTILERYVNTNRAFWLNPQTNLKGSDWGIKAIGQVINEGDTKSPMQFTCRVARAPLIFCHFACWMKLFKLPPFLYSHYCNRDLSICIVQTH